MSISEKIERILNESVAKSITIKVDEETYNKLVKMKGEYAASTVAKTVEYMVADIVWADENYIIPDRR